VQFKYTAETNTHGFSSGRLLASCIHSPLLLHGTVIAMETAQLALKLFKRSQYAIKCRCILGKNDS